MSSLHCRQSTSSRPSFNSAPRCRLPSRAHPTTSLPPLYLPWAQTHLAQTRALPRSWRACPRTMSPLALSLTPLFSSPPSPPPWRDGSWPGKRTIGPTGASDAGRVLVQLDGRHTLQFAYLIPHPDGLPVLPMFDGIFDRELTDEHWQKSDAATEKVLRKNVRSQGGSGEKKYPDVVLLTNAQQMLRVLGVPPRAPSFPAS